MNNYQVHTYTQYSFAQAFSLRLLCAGSGSPRGKKSEENRVRLCDSNSHDGDREEGGENKDNEKGMEMRV